MNFDKESRKSLEKYNKYFLKNSKTVEYRGHHYSHILPNELRHKNFLIPLNEIKFCGPYLEFLNIDNCPIKLHSYGTHLNSSQVLCINFFYEFIKDKNKLQKLVDYFDIGKQKVESACFEYGLCDESEIDFCILLNNKKRIYCEIKYKETFGGVSDKKNPKYPIKKKVFYRDADISFDHFCDDYQFIRNVCAAKRDDSWAIFIFPKRNELASEHFKKCVDHLKNKQDFKFKPIYWEDLIKAFPNKKVKDKYFWYI